MPAAGEDNHEALVDSSLQQRGLAVVEFGDHFRCRLLFHGKRTVFPKVNFREVAIARISERNEQRMPEVDLAEEQIIGCSCGRRS